MKKEFNPIYVKWIDSEVPDGPWHDIDSDHAPQLVDSFGILVKETKDFLILAISLDKENLRAGPMQYIPKVAIKDMYKGKFLFKRLRLLNGQKE
jgi:hypothetical protein